MSPGKKNYCDKNDRLQRIKFKLKKKLRSKKNLDRIIYLSDAMWCDLRWCAM